MNSGEHYVGCSSSMKNSRCQGKADEFRPHDRISKALDEHWPRHGRFEHHRCESLALLAASGSQVTLLALAGFERLQARHLDGQIFRICHPYERADNMSSSSYPLISAYERRAEHSPLAKQTN